MALERGAQIVDLHTSKADIHRWEQKKGYMWCSVWCGSVESSEPAGQADLTGYLSESAIS